MKLTDYSLKQRITFLRLFLPLLLVLMVVVYQLGLARWVEVNFGSFYHYGVEILGYSTFGPLLTYWTLRLIGRWLDEKEDAENLASASERRLAAITTASADAILSVDAHGQIKSWNRGADLLFGYSSAEVRGQLFATLLDSETTAEVEYQWLVEAVHREGYIRGHETVCRDASGEVVYVELTATQLTDDLGNLVGMSLVLRDITNRRRREEEIRRLNESLNYQVAERTEELAVKVEELGRANNELQKLDQMRAEFVSLVTHQIRAPLTNMSGAVQRIKTGCGSINPTCTRMFAILDQQTARLDRLVQDVMNTTRLEAGELVIQPEPVSVVPVVQQVIEQIRARTADRPIQLLDKPGLPLAYADRDRLAEVLTNLLDNADKYSPPGREVVVDVRANQDEITITVQDSGPGLPLEALERVFDKFYRTDSSDSQVAYGYGLGLYVCARLVEAQGGRVWAENHPKGGAIFSFSLPVWKDAHDL